MKTYGDLRKWAIFSYGVKQGCAEIERLMRFLNTFPGCEDCHPTLEIFSYDSMKDAAIVVNKCGIAHIAFEVDDVKETLQLLLQKGDKRIGNMKS